MCVKVCKGICFNVWKLIFFLISYYKASALINFFAVSWIWSFQFRSASILITRYLIYCKGRSLFFAHLKFYWKFSDFIWCLAFSQIVRLFISRLVYLLRLFINLLSWNKFLASGKLWILQNLLTQFRSLIYIKNKNGLRTELWSILSFKNAWLETW